MGYLLLEGGAEFGGRMAEPDRLAIARAGGPDAALRLIPAAAAPDRNAVRAGRNGERWFRGLGARNVAVVPLVDAASADDPTIVSELSRARLIYLLGGFTHYLGQTLAGGAAAQALRAAHAAGAVIAGSSAGAMVLCEHYYDPAGDAVHAGLGFVPGACVLPHHDTFGHKWAARLLERLPGVLLIGLDEQTGVLDDGTGRAWQVLGRGAATLYWGGLVTRYAAGEGFERPGSSAPLQT